MLFYPKSLRLQSAEHAVSFTYWLLVKAIKGKHHEIRPRLRIQVEKRLHFSSFPKAENFVYVPLLMFQ